MRYIGIDIAAETHAAAIIDEAGSVLLKPTKFGEEEAGYEKLRALIGEPEGALVVAEATGHYWQNLFAFLIAEGFAVVLLNPLRTSRFAGEDLRRAKTDALDALALARFGQQKRPAPTALPDEATLELRELVRLRARLVQDLGDRTRQLHRIVDLGFPEFTKLVPDLASDLALALLSHWPTAKAFQSASAGAIANLLYDGRHAVGRARANDLIALAKRSVGAHHGPAYRTQAEYACEDIRTLKARLRKLERDISGTLENHKIGSLLTTIDGIGDTTAALLVAELGDISRFTSADALAAYVGVVPGLSQSGKKTGNRASISGLGSARLRKALYMPTLAAVRCNPWLRAFYERLRAAGKLPKVAITASIRKLLHAIYSVATNMKPFEPRLPAAVVTS